MAGSNPLWSGLAGGAVVFILTVVAGRAKPLKPDSQGWTTLRPGAILTVGFALSLIIFATTTLALATIGNRADWHDQITALLCLVVGSGAATFYMGWVGWSRVIRFNEAEIEVRHRFRDAMTQPWSQVRGVTTNSVIGEHVLTFGDGQKLRVPTMMKGANDLALKLREQGFQ